MTFTFTLITLSGFWCCCFLQSATRVGVSLSAALSYQLEPVCLVHTCADTRTCSPTFRPCVELYNSWSRSYVELYAWYQLRSVKWCRGRLPWGGSFVSTLLPCLGTNKYTLYYRTVMKVTSHPHLN